MSTAPMAQGPVDVNVSRQCTCHPEDNPPTPCARQYALDACRLNVDDIEACLPEGALSDDATGKTLVSTQWLHDFARAVEAKVWGEKC